MSNFTQFALLLTARDDIDPALSGHSVVDIFSVILYRRGVPIQQKPAFAVRYNGKQLEFQKRELLTSVGQQPR